MSLTVVVSTRSNGVTMRPVMSSGDRPVYCHAVAITGTPMLGKISTGVRAACRMPTMPIRIDITMKVSGRARAIRTIPFIAHSFFGGATGTGGPKGLPNPARSLGGGGCRGRGVRTATHLLPLSLHVQYGFAPYRYVSDIDHGTAPSPLFRPRRQRAAFRPRRRTARHLATATQPADPAAGAGAGGAVVRAIESKGPPDRRGAFVPR